MKMMMMTYSENVIGEFREKVEKLCGNGRFEQRGGWWFSTDFEGLRVCRENLHFYFLLHSSILSFSLSHTHTEMFSFDLNSVYLYALWKEWLFGDYCECEPCRRAWVNKIITNTCYAIVWWACLGPALNTYSTINFNKILLTIILYYLHNLVKHLNIIW